MTKSIAIIGGGPAGLAAAEALINKGHKITIYEAMPTPARKFLWAGKSGLNITHAEKIETFKTRFGEASDRLNSALDDFSSDAIQKWANDLGVETFVGSSARVFPNAMKASPLLRAWLNRLDQAGVELKTRHKWVGFENDKLKFETPNGSEEINADATILALGGASYQRLGSTAEWVPWLAEREVAITPFKPANCGFDVAWSDHFIERFAGAPVKTVRATSDHGTVKGEFVISKTGVEGSLIYTHSACLRNKIDTDGLTTLTLDLVPGKTVEQLTKSLERQNPKHSFSNRLRKGTRLAGVKAALVRELQPNAGKLSPNDLANLLKNLPVELQRTRPIDEAISVAGGIQWAEIDANFMLTKIPSIFVAGEMIDWEAPTGGYLITACMATGRAAGRGALNWLSENEL